MKNLNIENEDLDDALKGMRQGEQGNIVNNGMHFMKVPGGVLFYNEYYGITFVPVGEKPKTMAEKKVEKPMNEKKVVQK